MMAEIDAGVLPVAERDRLVGMITDRDIAIRAVAAGKGPDTAVRDRESSQLVGILSLADIAVKHVPQAAGDALARLSKQGGPHSQTKA